MHNSKNNKHIVRKNMHNRLHNVITLPHTEVNIMKIGQMRDFLDAFFPRGG